ncbi:MAG: sigma-70 family RNA polymerase sigma factor [Verrucomicrobia bacterium]|nr:sigma-70 family RNA polymerase sigma factor [Verrucomicrobiota bacterium]MCH8512877.1 sigma-70 family RNA polymerase sigma factor [Kiritimatiellia bacterium]
MSKESKETEQMELDRAEVRDAVKGLPFKPVHIEEFDDPDYEPESVRQERRYGRPDSHTQPITRFLGERGMVDILTSDQIEELFREIHWCCEQIRRLAESDSEDPAYWREALKKTIRLMQRTEAAEEELFIANRQLVVACVKPFYWIGQIWISDFLQEGSRALANAIRKFDFSRGIPFYAYSQRSIQNRLRNFFRDHIRTGALGMKPSHDMTRMLEVIQKWRDRHGEDPSEVVVCEMTDLPPERVKRLMPLVRQWERMPDTPLSLDAVLGDSRSSLHELVADSHQEEVSAETERGEIWEAIGQLPERMQLILKLRFVEGRTLEDVGNEFGLTRARIKQLQDEALHKVRLLLRQTRNR